MEIKTFYKSQLEVAAVLVDIIDAYLENRVQEKVMIDNINNIVKNNKEKVMKENEFTTVVKQKVGKRRLSIISKILELS